MREDRIFEEWKRARAVAPVPEGFADRVMAAALGTARGGRLIPALVCTAAALAGIARAAALLLLFVKE